jgi:serine phosphatase RsbU (regulator of sigma subunit)
MGLRSSGMIRDGDQDCQTPAVDHATLIRELTGELANFQEIAQELLPQAGDMPRLKGMDVFGGVYALNGTVGGDHLIYLDFKQRFNLAARIDAALARRQGDVVDHLRRRQHMAGIVLIDVAGHRVTDALLGAMLHQALLVGAMYELDMSGRITRRLFENLNARFYASSGAHKFISMLYGEVSEDARVRFLSAGQPVPAVFSNEHDRLMEVDAVSFPPLGLLPSLGMIDDRPIESPLGFKDPYTLNEWSLMGPGDILLLHTDGLAEHYRDGVAYFPVHLEHALRRLKDRTAKEIYEGLMADMVAFAEATDDVSLVVVKRE